MYGHQKNSSSADSAGFSQRRRQWNYRGTYHRIWCMVHLKLVKQLLFADVIKSKIGWLTLRGSVIFYVTALMSDADRLVVFMQFDVRQITDYDGIYSLLYRSEDVTFHSGGHYVMEEDKKSKCLHIRWSSFRKQKEWKNGWTLLHPTAIIFDFEKLSLSKRTPSLASHRDFVVHIHCEWNCYYDHC